MKIFEFRMQPMSGKGFKRRTNNSFTKMFNLPKQKAPLVTICLTAVVTCVTFVSTNQENW